MELRLRSRTERSFLTKVEKPWLAISAQQAKELVTLFRASYREKQEAARGEDGRIRYKFTYVENQLKADLEKSQELYEIAQDALLPQQVEELHRLDRWRFLNIRPFDQFMKSKLFFESTMESEEFTNAYRDVLQNSIDKLSEIQKTQHQQLLKALPTRWKEKLKQIGTDNF